MYFIFIYNVVYPAIDASVKNVQTSWVKIHKIEKTIKNKTHYSKLRILIHRAVSWTRTYY